MNRLKFLREEKGLYQSDIAKIIGTSITAITYYENEKRDMSTEVLKKLSDFFDVSIDYLLGKTDERNSNNSIDEHLLKLGLDMKNDNPPSEEQKKQIEEFAKYVLKDNKKE